jgi:acetyl esterase/lipase
VSTDGPGRAELVGALEKYVVKKDIAGHRDIYENASPIHHVRADAPPFFVLHGSNDSLIPVGEAREFVAALRDASESPVGYAELPGAQHAFDTLGSPRGHNTAVAVQRFLDWTRTRAAAEPDTDASAQRA